MFGRKPEAPQPSAPKNTLPPQTELVEDHEKALKLPELELRKICESPSAIEGAIHFVKPWHSYTLLSADRSGSLLLILDESAQRDESFTGPLNHKTVRMRWIEDNRGGYNTKRVTDQSQRVGSGTVLVSSLPLLTRGFARTALETARRNSISSDAELAESGGFQNFTEASGFNRCITSTDQRYILLFNDDTRAWVGFNTESESGLVLAPKDWERIDLDKVNIRSIPDGIVDLVEQIESRTDLKKVNDQYSALVTDVGVNIVPAGDPKSRPVFSDLTPSIENNIAPDPKDSNTLFYCPGGNAKSLTRLHMEGDPKDWKKEVVGLPKTYEEVRNLQLDPSGNFFLFFSNNDLVITAKTTFEEVKRVPGMTHVSFDNQGNIRAIDKNKKLVVLQPDFESLQHEIDKQNIARIASGVDIIDIFAMAAAKKKAGLAENMEHLVPLRERYAQDFNVVIQSISTLDGIEQLRAGFAKLRSELQSGGLRPNEVAFVVEGLEEPIKVKQAEIIGHETERSMGEVQKKLDAGVSLATLVEARADLEKLRGYEALMPEKLRDTYRLLALDVKGKAMELFQRRGDEIVANIRGIVTRTRSELQGFTSKAQMDDWMEFRYPQIKSQLGSLMTECPLEADEAYRSISSARQDIEIIAREYEERFKVEYAKVREVAAERMEATVTTLEGDMSSLLERIRNKKFADRGAAEAYLESSEAKALLEQEITALAGANPDVAKELHRALQVRLANVLGDIERGALTEVAATGQQMITIGKTTFPKWEAHVAEQNERTVDITFSEDPKSHGPGVKPKDIMGDVVVLIKDSTGKNQTVRLYEGWKDEQEWRLGLLSYRGEALPPSYLSAAEFQQIKRNYADWSRGDRSTIQKTLAEKRAAVKAKYAQREKVGARTERDETWKTEYQALVSDLSKFTAENNVPILRRIDDIKNEPSLDTSNGKGFVPTWQSHWVMDRQTEKDLELMADYLKMQGDLQEGILNLQGHAGTGKDVRVKMFSALTNRPYFGVDCTKWTTEYELSEDVTLESVDGASQTVRVPSTVLNGITTKGAIVYFNEFNAMPEQAQIFLHALMDEKRSITLKTSSGKVVKADPSVLLMCSMNPGYPGTFEPQFATRSRMVSMDVDYPPLTRSPEKGDKNPNPVFDVSEPLRVAREIDSLTDLTYEPNLERNKFAKMWDKYVNGIANDSEDPTPEQRFDIDTIVALTQFGDKLRGDFKKIFEKSRSARNALPVNQPITGRELRRCAYALSSMPKDQKATANPEVVARDLIRKFFLGHIDNVEDRSKIETAMGTWTSQKRVRA